MQQVHRGCVLTTVRNGGFGMTSKLDFSPAMQPSSASAAAQVSQALHIAAARHSHGMLWLAVDAANPNAEPLPAELDAALRGPGASTVPLRHPDIDPSSQPRWLALNTEHANGSWLVQQSIEFALAELHPASLQQGCGRRIAGWLYLDGELSDALRHWGSQMIQRKPGGQRCLLRLHDPAVLWTLWDLLSPAQRDDLLGAIQCWWLLDPAGHLVSLRPSATPTEKRRSPWSAQLWQNIDHVASLNAALRHWLSRAEAATPSQATLSDARAAAMAAMRRARAAGFKHQNDLCAYARLAVTVHPDFDTHPRVRQATAQRKQDDSFATLVYSLTAEDWTAIAADLQAQHASLTR
jgi:hypothetical protein